MAWRAIVANRRRMGRAQNKFRRLIGAPVRLARRRGFGIHSPFAFDFVKRVIAQPYAYYCYPELKALAKRSGLKATQLKLLFRVVLFVRPATYSIAGPDSDALRQAIAAGAPAARQVDAAPQPQMLVVNGNVDTANAIEAARGEAVIVVFNQQRNSPQLRKIFSAIDNGMMFCGSTTTIFVCRSHLPKQAFNVWM